MSIYLAATVSAQAIFRPISTANRFVIIYGHQRERDPNCTVPLHSAFFIVLLRRRAIQLPKTQVRAGYAVRSQYTGTLIPQSFQQCVFRRLPSSSLLSLRLLLRFRGNSHGPGERPEQRLVSISTILTKAVYLRPV